ncbi:trigger factor [Tumidithrix helvetica PCC 7403]|uniref:trigger factor n=1 Tax=Tumidithrix helvetica TaxID=3457545 RepID=UPI003CB8E6AB
MKVTLEKLPASQVGFDIEVEGAKSQAIYDRMVKKLTQTMQVPGFRKGKAPKQLILRQVGVQQINASVLEELIEDTLQKALAEQKDLKAIGGFELVSDIEELIKQFAPGQDLQFKAAIDVQPEVKLNKYQGFEVKAEKIEADLTQVDKTLHDYQVRKSTLVPVENRGAQLDDVATIDLKVIDLETGEEIADASEDGIQVDVNENDYIPVVVQNLIGVALDATIEIESVFPEDYYPEEYVGKKIKYVVTLKDLKARELPALDDEFAQSISEKETIAELREFLEKRILDEAEEKTKANKENAILQALVAELEVDLPASLIKQEVNFLVQQQAMYLQRQIDPKFAKQLFTPELVKEMRRINEPEAIVRLKRTLALAEVAKLESVTVPEDAIAARAEEIKQSVQDNNVDPVRLREVVEDELVTEKVLEWLTEKATIELVPEGSLKPEVEPSSDVEANLEAGSEATSSNAIIDVASETVAPESETTESVEPVPTPSITKGKGKAKADKQAAKNATNE